MNNNSEEIIEMRTSYKIRLPFNLFSIFFILSFGMVLNKYDFSIVALFRHDGFRPLILLFLPSLFSFIVFCFLPNLKVFVHKEGLYQEHKIMIGKKIIHQKRVLIRWNQITSIKSFWPRWFPFIGRAAVFCTHEGKDYMIALDMFKKYKETLPIIADNVPSYKIDRSLQRDIMRYRRKKEMQESYKK